MRSFNSYRQVALFAVLLAVALVLGGLLHRGLGTGDAFRFTRSTAPRDIDRRGEDDQDLLRKVPDQRAPEEVKRAYYDLVSRLAKPASVLDVSGCAATPLALKVAEGSTITIRNVNAVAHTINIGQQKVPVPANGTTLLTAAFDTGPGIYGYGCDTGLAIIGVFFVTSP